MTDSLELDAARARIAAAGLTASASAFLTEEVAMRLPFESLGPFKNLLKAFFSPLPWTDDHRNELNDLVRPHLDDDAWFTHDLGKGLVLSHGIRNGRYVLDAAGAHTHTAPSIFDRVFDGPVVPEPTPHPRKVKFNIGGDPAPGRWYRRSDDVDDDRVAALLEDDHVTDVMVAGDFVTVGLARSAPWELHLDPMLDRVTELFWTPERAVGTAPARTREELVEEGLQTRVRARPEELHLLDPDDAEHRTLLEEAAAEGDARLRRVAVATLSGASNRSYAADVLWAGYGDESRLVRRVAIDAAADAEEEGLRPLLEDALDDEDPWIRWKSVRALRDIDIGPSREEVAALREDPDFQVRFEVEAALRTVGH